MELRLLFDTMALTTVRYWVPVRPLVVGAGPFDTIACRPAVPLVRGLRGGAAPASVPTRCGGSDRGRPTLILFHRFHLTLGRRPRDSQLVMSAKLGSMVLTPSPYLSPVPLPSHDSPASAKRPPLPSKATGLQSYPVRIPTPANMM